MRKEIIELSKFVLPSMNTKLIQLIKLFSFKITFNNIIKSEFQLRKIPTIIKIDDKLNQLDFLIQIQINTNGDI